MLVEILEWKKWEEHPKRLRRNIWDLEMKISNPCLEDFKIKITPTKLKKHKLEEKKRILELFHFQKHLLSLHRQPKPYCCKISKFRYAWSFFGKTENDFGMDFISPILSTTATGMMNLGSENGVLGLLWEDCQNKNLQFFQAFKKGNKSSFIFILRC